MIIENTELQASLKTGFIDSIYPSRPDYLPQLLHNDKEKGTKILSSIQNELQKCDEFWFSVAFLTTSGVATLINTLAELEKRKIRGKILVSSYLYFTQPEALKRILQFKNIELKLLETGEFHSKGYLFKRGDLYNLIIGSSNLTQSALSTNKEWNLKVTATPQSKIIINALELFENEFKIASIVNEKVLKNYAYKYYLKLNFEKRLKIENQAEKEIERVEPNRMQIEALRNIESIRNKGEDRALLISATGTGKTFLSAFDVERFNPKKFLFIVHRRNIAEAALRTFKKVIKKDRTFGIYSGEDKELECDFLFATIQTISRDSHLSNFSRDQFDYIVIDESHRAGAESYKKILEYFTPKFLLGMTATPERTDGLDIFKLYNYNIAYEIRLHQAMEEEMLSPFHYYGVTDIEVDGKLLDEKTDFNLLTSNERVNRIIEKAEFYGCDDGDVRGIVFCSKVEECIKLSDEFNKRGYKSIALTGESSDEDRTNAINDLESDNSARIKYIFTRDIFNEGIDIPRVNQVIMLRPTDSAIVFVQQLGRGLRKSEGKEYLTVIDFIGNYSNNYLVPIALYGDNSYNKDKLRKLLASGSNLIPGQSTINFDEISKKRIFDSIDNAKLRRKADLDNDFKLLKYKLGRTPMMMDFIEHGSRDPFLFVEYAGSYCNYLIKLGNLKSDILNENELKILNFLCYEINNSKRVEESELLKIIINKDFITYIEFRDYIFGKYKFEVNIETFNSCINSINLNYIREKDSKKLVIVGKLLNTKLINIVNNQYSKSEQFSNLLKKKVFKEYLNDSIEYSITTYNSFFSLNKFYNGFVLNRKYSRKDVFRILNWQVCPVMASIGGYSISQDKSNCALFVNYHKEDNKTSSPKYQDRFIDENILEWSTKSPRRLESKEVNTLLNNGTIRKPLFVKKRNDEGDEHYYMGDVEFIKESARPDKIPDKNGMLKPVVIIKLKLQNPVENNLYNYITEL